MPLPEKCILYYTNVIIILIHCIPGLCSNACANANAAFALAFYSPMVDAFTLAYAFDSSAFAIALDSNAFDWNQMRDKCESNETVLLLHNVYS